MSFHGKYGNGQFLRNQQDYLFWFSNVAESIKSWGYEKKSSRVSEVVRLLLEVKLLHRKCEKSESPLVTLELNNCFVLKLNSEGSREYLVWKAGIIGF